VKTVKLSKAQREQMTEALMAPDGIAWMSVTTLRNLERRGLVERLHPTCAGVRLTDAGRAALDVLS